MEQIETEILQYEAQLAQVRLAAAAVEDSEEKEKLEALEADLVELINLSKSSLKELKSDPLSEQYKLFKAEINDLTSGADDNSQNSDSQISKSNITESHNLGEELDNLKGTKCQAPFTYKWTNDVTYYNAFITHVPEPDEISSYDEIYVKVMFTNPTHKEMLPCPYYLDGKCKFNDENCKYSHGELVLLSSLKKYRVPDFSKLDRGCKVLAKQDDELWYRASVISVNETQCLLKFDTNSKEEQILFHNILPLDYNISCNGDTSSDEENDMMFSPQEKKDELVRRILSAPPGSAIGEWEKFTKGFGSKIMAKMGYIPGSGLGKNGMGLVEPVPAVILPAGKSLDYCMMLKEKAGNDKDLFKAERKMKHLQKKHEEKLKKAYEAEKGKTDVFSFLNSTLHSPQSSQFKEVPKTKVKNEYKNETTKNLNVTGLQVAEELRKVEKEIKSLNQSLTRHSPHTHGYNIIKEKLTFKENKLAQLHASERKIRNEQNLRKDREKLTVF